MILACETELTAFNETPLNMTFKNNFSPVFAPKGLSDQSNSLFTGRYEGTR